MNERQIDCDDARLGILLEGDEDSDEFRSLAEHLESCNECQGRLTDLAADGEMWDDVSSLLRGYESPEDSDESNKSLPSGERNLRFLSPPTHPEMLGRLGRYEIEKVIGSGGMGVVLKGHDTELNRPVAIKVLAPHLAHSGAARQRFAREGRAAAAVVHEHVVAIHNVEAQAEVPYLVMQYVPGQSLQSRVDQLGPLTTKEILRIGIQAASGLAAAHAQGVVHRDIKPSNILLENDVDRALLTDFGLARAADDATLTRTGVIAGTPHYMSPEQASGRSADEKSDLFSLGALLYFMATGHPPFRAEQPLAVLNRICKERHRPVWEINPDIADGLSDIIDRLLEKNPSKRFANAEETRSALLKLLGKLQQPGAKRQHSKFRRWLRTRHRLLLGSAALVVLVVMGLSTVSIYESWVSKPIQPEVGNGAIESSEGQEDVRQVIAELNTTDTEPSGEFASELAETKRQLQRIENGDSASAGHALRPNDDDWYDEVQELKNQISEIEESQLINPQPPGVKR